MMGSIAIVVVENDFLDENERDGGQLKQGSGIGKSRNTVTKGVDDHVKEVTNIICDLVKKSQIDQAESEVLRNNKELKIKEAERTAVLNQLEPLIVKDKSLEQMLKWKKTDSINHQHSQGKLFRARTVSRERVVDLCSSREELMVLAERTEIISQLKLLSLEDKKLRKTFKWRKKDIKAEQAQEKLCTERTSTHESSVASEREPNDLIASKLSQMQHGSRTLAEEKKILQEIVLCVELSTIELSTPDETTKAETQYTRVQCVELLARKKAIEDRIRVKDVDLKK